MSAVISIRIPKKLKEEMDKLRDVVDWSKEIREFIEYRIRVYQRMKVLNEIDKLLEELPSTPRGFASKAVREDRDSHRCFSSSEVYP